MHDRVPEQLAAWARMRQRGPAYFIVRVVALPFTLAMAALPLLWALYLALAFHQPLRLVLAGLLRPGVPHFLLRVLLPLTAFAFAVAALFGAVLWLLAERRYRLNANTVYLD